MKRFMTNLMLAAAALTAASGAVSAAELKFEIPFSFQAAGKMLPAGVYRIHPATDESSFHIYNPQTREGVYVFAVANKDPQKQWAESPSGVMEFVCRDNRCSLTGLWSHQGYPMHKLANPSRIVEGSGPSRVALIRAVVGRAK